MKISNSKKELARIISEHGGWRNGEFAAQDGDDCAVWFYDNAPVRSSGAWRATSGSGLGHCGIEDVAKLPNWHQTILSRAEYFHLYPAPDADGWIEWLRDELPVEEGVIIDVKYSDGDELHSAPCGVFTTNMTSIRGELASAECFGRGDGSFVHIIAYRLHKPEQADPEFCESVTRAIPDPDEQVWTNPPSIEQLAADYSNAKDYAERKQQEADAAKADAEAKLKALELAGEALGLLVSSITAKQEPELVIAVQVGDEVECVESNINRDKYNGMVGRLCTIDESDTSTPYLVDFDGEAKIWCHKVKFIRRP